MPALNAVTHVTVPIVPGPEFERGPTALPPLARPVHMRQSVRPWSERMNRILVAVFDGEEKAYEGRKALRQLDAEGSVLVYSAVVVARGVDGSAGVKKEDGGPLGTVLGTTLGALVGLLGGPAGAAVGGVAGMTLGLITDLETARIGTDFVEDVQTALKPGKAAMIADVEEEWTERVDEQMEALGGTVYRRSLSYVRDTADDEDEASIRSEIAQLKAEHAQARTEQKAKLRDRLNELDSRLEERLQRAKERRERAREEARAKVALLKTRAAQARARVTSR